MKDCHLPLHKKEFNQKGFKIGLILKTKACCQGAPGLYEQVIELMEDTDGKGCHGSHLLDVFKSKSCIHDWLYIFG